MKVPHAREESQMWKGRARMDMVVLDWNWAYDPRTMIFKLERQMIDR